MSTAHRSPSLEDHGIHDSQPAQVFHDETRKRKRAGGQPTQELGLMRGTEEHDRARFVGSGSGIHYIRAVYLRLANKSLTRNNNNSLAAKNMVPGEDDQLNAGTASEQALLWKPGEVTASTELVDDKHSFEDLVDWSKSYFELWHPILPLLHGYDALRIFHQVSDNGVSSLDPLDCAILKSILSISLSDRRQGNRALVALPSNIVFHTVQDAVSTSQFALSQPASVRSTQAALSIQLCLISMLCLNAASRLGGVIVRMALHLGLHRCPARFAFFSVEDVLLRQRLFWCIYTLERFLCQSLGLPLDMHDDDLDVCYPGEEKHGSMDQGGKEAEKLQLLTHIAKHARIRGLILELRNKTFRSRQDDAERTAYVEAEFAKWSNQIQDILEDEEEDEDSEGLTVSPSHRLILLVLKHESTICLHRPLMASVTPSPSYFSALQTCVSAAKSILINLKRHLSKRQSGKDSDHPLAHAVLTWPSFTWAVWISTFVLLHAASERQIGLQNAMKHVNAGKGILRHIATRDTAWPEYCLEAVDELTSVVQELLTPKAGTQGFDDSPATIDSCSDTGHASRRRYSMSRISQPRSQDINSIPNGPDIHQAKSNQAIRNGSFEATHSDSIPPYPPLSSAVAPSQGMHPQASPHVPFHTSGLPHFKSPHHLDAGPDFSAELRHKANTIPESLNTFLSPDYDSSQNFVPAEGQNPIRWYDQLFQSSFSAIDNPFLVAAEHDSSINPAWGDLR